MGNPQLGTGVLLCVNIPYITSLLHHGYYIIHLLYMRYYSSTGSKVVSSTGSKDLSIK